MEKREEIALRFLELAESKRKRYGAMMDISGLKLAFRRADIFLLASAGKYAEIKALLAQDNAED